MILKIPYKNIPSENILNKKIYENILNENYISLLLLYAFYLTFVLLLLIFYPNCYFECLFILIYLYFYKYVLFNTFLINRNTYEDDLSNQKKINLKELNANLYHDINGNVYLSINNNVSGLLNNYQNKNEILYSLDINKNNDIEFSEIDKSKLIELQNTQNIEYDKIINSDFSSLKKKH